MFDFELLWFMVIAHSLADMSWQPSFIAHNKHRFPVLMFFHAMSVTGAVSIAMYTMGYFSWTAIVILLVSHIIIDSWKSRQIKDDAHMYCIYIDQGLHLLFMILAAVIVFNTQW